MTRTPAQAITAQAQRLWAHGYSREDIAKHFDILPASLDKAFNRTHTPQPWSTDMPEPRIAATPSDLARLDLDFNWREAAACASVDPELFFTEGDGANYRNDAKKVCAACPVKIECLDYALAANEQYGMWGGTSAKQREQMRSQRGAA